MALRFLLGAAEAGFGPSIPFLLSFFYLRHELGFRSGIFLAAAPLANTFAGALAYGITSGHSKLANWRLLFLVEGLPTILAAPVAFFFLPDSPVHARFLTEEEKTIARARGVRQTGEAEKPRGVVVKDIGRTLLDAKAWFTAVSRHTTVAEYSLMAWEAHVLFLQRLLFVPTGLSAHDPQRNGLLGDRRPRPFRATLFYILHRDHRDHLDCGPTSAARLDDYLFEHGGRHRLHSARGLHRGRPEVFWNFSGRIWRLSCDCEYLAMGGE